MSCIRNNQRVPVCAAYTTPKFSLTVLASAVGLALATPGYAANNIEVVAGSNNVNINAASPFVSTNDTAQLGADLLTGATGGFSLSTGTGGSNLQDGDVTFGTAIDYNGLGRSVEGVDGAWYQQTLSINAHDDIYFNQDFYDSNAGFEYFGLELNPDSDGSGGGSVYIQADVTGGWLIGSPLADTTVNGDMRIMNGGSFTSAFLGIGETLVTGNLTIDAGGALNTVFLTAGTLSVDPGATLEINNLTLTNSGIAIDSSGPLGANATLFNLDVLSQTVGTGDADSGTLTINGANDVAGALTINSGGTYNLNGSLTTATVVNDGQFNFVSGSLHLTADDLAVDSAGLLGDTVADRDIHVVNQTVGTADPDSGSVTMNEGFTNTVDGVLTVNSGGTYNLSGGNLDAGTINNSGSINLTAGSLTTESISNNGAFNYAGGNLTMTAGGYGVEAGGLFGDSLTLNAHRLTVQNATVGTADAASGTVTQSGGVFTSVHTINDTLTINAGGTYNLGGGTLNVGSLVNNGTLNFTEGRLQINNDDLTVGATGILGDNLQLSSGKDIVLGTAANVTVDAGAAFSLDGGSLTTGSITNNGSFAFNFGSLRLTASDLTVGTGELLGDSLTLVAGKSLSFDNGHQLIVDASGSLVLDGGSLSADDVVNNGTFQFLRGNLTFLGGTSTGAGNLLGASTTLGADTYLSVGGTGLNIASGTTVTLDGGEMHVNQVANGGGFNFVSGYLQLTSNQDVSVGSSGTLTNDVVIGTGSEINVNWQGGGNVVVNGDGSLTLDGGRLIADDLINNGSFAFNSGELYLDQGMVVGSAGILGDDVVIGNNMLLDQETTIVIDSGASFEIAGGSVRADQIVNNGGTFAFTSGELIYQDGLHVGVGGLLGDTVSLDSGKILTLWNGPSEVTIDAGASLAINGGEFTSGPITNNGSFAFNSGKFTYDDSLVVGSTGLLGDNVALRSDRELNMRSSGNVVTVEAGARVLVQDGDHVLAKTDNDGTVQVNAGSLSVEGGIANQGNVVVAAGAELVGNFQQTSGRTLVDGTLRTSSTAGVVIDGGELTGSGQVNANLTLNDGKLAPGNSPGTMEVTGDFIMTGGEISFELADDGAGGYLWDQLIVGGAYDLVGGGVRISLLDGWDISDLVNDFTIGDFFREGEFSGSTLLSDSPFDVANLGMFSSLELFAYDVTDDSWFSLGLDGTGGFLPTPTTSPVPVPAAAWLFGSGLLGLFGVARRRRAA